MSQHIFFPLMFRSLKYSSQILLGLFLIIPLGSFGLSTVKESFAANLRNMAVIEDSVIRASDVFEGLQYKADTILGPAPHPGKDMILNARTLLRIAVALDLPWRPSGVQERIIIRRAATIVSPQFIEEKLNSSLKNKGVSGRFSLNFHAPINSLVLPKDKDATVEINHLSYDAAAGSFRAELVAPSQENPIIRREITGYIEKIMSVPVLNTTLQHGDLIGARDIKWIDMKQSDIQHDLILKAERLQGHTPRRIAIAGEPQRHREIVEPLLVSRGDSVSIIFKQGPIELIADGKALQNGSDGDLVRVVNTSSNRSLDAVVSGDREVIVQ